jgi:hypothetical protein
MPKHTKGQVDQSPSISEEAVEELAKRLVPQSFWDDIEDERRAFLLDEARNHIIAIYPLLCGEEERLRKELDAANRRIEGFERDLVVPYNAGLVARAEQAEEELERVRAATNCGVSLNDEIDLGWDDDPQPEQSSGSGEGRHA